MDYTQVKMHKMRPFIIKCTACKARWSYDELPKNNDTDYFKCCNHGEIKYKFDKIRPILFKLFLGLHPKSNHFKKEIIRYNSCFSFASFNVVTSHHFHEKNGKNYNFQGGGNFLNY